MTSVPGDGRESSILEAFVDLADSLDADYDPLDFLYRLLDHSIPLTGGAAGAVLLEIEGRLHLVASSSEYAEDVELFERQDGPGPAREAFDSGETVRVGPLAEARERWPEFVTAADAHGWTAAFAVPLRLREHVVGAFVVFWVGDEPCRPDEADAELLRGFADVATIAVLHRRATADAERITEQLHGALQSRVQVEQAKGMVAQATDGSVGEAFELLRRHARSQSRRVADVARSVLSGELDVDKLTRS